MRVKGSMIWYIRIFDSFFFFFLTELWSAYLNDRREIFSKTGIPNEIFVKYLNKSVRSYAPYPYVHKRTDINFAHSLSRCGQIRAVMWCKIINFYATFIGLIKFDKHDRNTSAQRAPRWTIIVIWASQNARNIPFGKINGI